MSEYYFRFISASRNCGNLGSKLLLVSKTGVCVPQHINLALMHQQIVYLFIYSFIYHFGCEFFKKIRLVKGKYKYILSVLHICSEYRAPNYHMAQCCKTMLFYSSKVYCFYFLWCEWNNTTHYIEITFKGCKPQQKVFCKLSLLFYQFPMEFFHTTGRN